MRQRASTFPEDFDVVFTKFNGEKVEIQI
jgi:hypothetical protein